MQVNYILHRFCVPQNCPLPAVGEENTSGDTWHHQKLPCDQAWERWRLSDVIRDWTQRIHARSLQGHPYSSMMLRWYHVIHQVPRWMISTSIVAYLSVSSLSHLLLLSFITGIPGPKPLFSFSFIKLCLIVWYLSLSFSCWGTIFFPSYFVHRLTYCP